MDFTPFCNFVDDFINGFKGKTVFVPPMSLLISAVPRLLIIIFLCFRGGGLAYPIFSFADDFTSGLQ